MPVNSILILLARFTRMLKPKSKFNRQYTVIANLCKTIFFRNVFAVASGAVLAQTINMLFSPVITRLYGPEAFGIFGVYSSFVAIPMTIAALTYPKAIVLPKEDSEAKVLVKLSLYVTLIISSLMTLIVIFFGEMILETLKIEILTPYMLLIPLTMLFNGLLQIMQQWRIRKKEFKVIAQCETIMAFLENGAKSCTGFFSPGAAALIYIGSFGHGLHAFLLSWRDRGGSGVKEADTKTVRERLSSIRILGKKYRDFPFFMAPEMFITAVSSSLPILMLTIFFGPAAAGFYGIGNRVLALPAQVIGRAVGDVFYPRITEAAYNKENISVMLKKSAFIMAVVGLLPFGIIVVWGPWLFGFVFGEAWVQAGQYARWMALWNYFMFINNPISRVVPVLSAQKFYLLFTIMNTIVRAMMLAVGGYLFKSDQIAIMLYSLAGMSAHIVLFIVVIRMSNTYMQKNL